MRTHSIPNQQVNHFLKPRRLAGSPTHEVELSEFFCDILRRANAFVPSDFGVIFLRDATAEEDGDATSPGVIELIVAASFGETAEDLVGLRVPAAAGTAGTVFSSAQSRLSAVPTLERLAPASGSPGPERAVIALPLTVGGEVVGVLELLSQRGGDSFSERELELLEIFAQTISISIANAVEAQRAKEMARRDELTRLYNDRYLHLSLSQVLVDSLERGTDCGVIFLDLDHFKNVNDAYGHLAGSRVLREMGDLLRQVLPGPAVPARYGGDEFVVILPESGRQEVYWVAETIRKTIETQVFLEKADPADPINYPALALSGVITCSLGIATLCDDILPLFSLRHSDHVAVKNEILRVADARMYRAKDLGRNRTLFAEEEGAELTPLPADSVDGAGAASG